MSEDAVMNARARLADLPKVDELAAQAAASADGVPRWAVVEAARQEIAVRRGQLLAGVEIPAAVPVTAVVARARDLVRPSLQRVVNATGVVLHTNLGRAPLAAAVVARVADIAAGYSNLEYELDERARGSRHDHVRALLTALSGAEAAVVVNNCAAAVLLALAATAAGREVVVSRGELIEIGGSFRVPDVMRASGARLVEVGTTNKTRSTDYATACGPDTAVLFKVHRSNFAMLGFVAEVGVAELVTLGRARGIPVVVDLGSGAFIDPATYGLPSEPTIGAQVAAGATLVTFSADKLLGGPQAGVIVGNADVLAQVRRHPLMRALRPDKLTLAALEATLELYRDGRAALEVPTLRMLTAAPALLEARARRLCTDIGPARVGVVVVAVSSVVGGGALPTAEPPSFALALEGRGRSAETLDAALRRARPAIIGRIAEDRLLLDVRTLFEDEFEHVVRTVRSL